MMQSLPILPAEEVRVVQLPYRSGDRLRMVLPIQIRPPKRVRVIELARLCNNQPQTTPTV